MNTKPQRKEYKLGEAANLIGVHPKTLQRWDREGKIKSRRTITNRRSYTQYAIDKALGKRRTRNDNK